MKPINHPLSPLVLPHLCLSALQLQTLLAAQFDDDQLMYELDKKSNTLSEVMDGSKNQAARLQQLVHKLKVRGLVVRRFLPLSQERILRTEQTDLQLRWLRYMLSNQIGVRFETPFPDWIRQSSRPLIEQLEHGLYRWQLDRIQEQISGRCQQPEPLTKTDLTNIICQFFTIIDELNASESSSGEAGTRAIRQQIRAQLEGGIQTLTGLIQAFPDPAQVEQVLETRKAFARLLVETSNAKSILVN